MAVVLEVKKEIRHESRGCEAGGQYEQAWEILKRER
jgi:hypothetical protein